MNIKRIKMRKKLTDERIMQREGKVFTRSEMVNMIDKTKNFTKKLLRKGDRVA